MNRCVKFLSIAVFSFSAMQSANAALVQLPAAPGFSTIINFDVDANGIAISDEADIFDQYVDLNPIGVKFRDSLTTYHSASTDTDDSPGEADNEMFRSPRNSLGEVEDVFILFENAITQIGGYLAGEENKTKVVLTAFDANLQSLGSVYINVGETFAFLGAEGALISAIKFSSDDEEFYLDDVGFTPVPLPAAFWLLGSSLIGLAWSFRQKSGKAERPCLLKI